MLMAAHNFPIICRICLEQGDLKPLEENIIELLETITDIDVMSESDLPKNVCTKCTKDIVDISEFIDKMKYNNMYLRYVLLNNGITIKHEPPEEIYKPQIEIYEPQIKMNRIEPANKIEGTSILRNSLNVEKLQNEERKHKQTSSISTGFKFVKNGVGSIKENHYVGGQMQWKEYENDSDFETQPSIQKKLKSYHSPRKPISQKIKNLKSEIEYKHKPDPKLLKRLLSCPTCFTRFSTQTNLKEHMASHNKSLNGKQSLNSICAMSFLKDNKFETLITKTPKLKIGVRKHNHEQKESLNEKETKGKITAISKLKNVMVEHKHEQKKETKGKIPAIPKLKNCIVEEKEFLSEKETKGKIPATPKLKIGIVEHKHEQKEFLNRNDTKSKTPATILNRTDKSEIIVDYNLFKSQDNFKLLIESKLFQDLIEHEFPT